MEIVQEEPQSNTFDSRSEKKIISADGESYRIETDERYESISFDTLEKMLPAQMFRALTSSGSSFNHAAERCTYDEHVLRKAFQNGTEAKTIAEVLADIIDDGFEHKEREDDTEVIKRKRGT